MANLCDNRLTICCDDEHTLNEIIAAASEIRKPLSNRIIHLLFMQQKETPSQGLLEYLCPVPENVEYSQLDSLPGLEDLPKSYQWRLSHWGCRNDVTINDYDRTGNKLHLSFSTDYSPPVEALQYGATQRDFRFRLLYCEPVGGFCGIANEFENREFELLFKDEPAEEGIPEELIATFDLNEIYQETREVYF